MWSMSNKIQLAHKDRMVKADINLNLTKEYFTHPVKTWFGTGPAGQLTYKMTFSCSNFSIFNISSH